MRSVLILMVDEFGCFLLEFFVCDGGVSEVVGGGSVATLANGGQAAWSSPSKPDVGRVASEKRAVA